NALEPLQYDDLIRINRDDDEMMIRDDVDIHHSWFAQQVGDNGDLLGRGLGAEPGRPLKRFAADEVAQDIGGEVAGCDVTTVLLGSIINPCPQVPQILNLEQHLFHGGSSPGDQNVWHDGESPYPYSSSRYARPLKRPRRDTPGRPRRHTM